LAPFRAQLLQLLFFGWERGGGAVVMYPVVLIASVFHLPLVLCASGTGSLLRFSESLEGDDKATLEVRVLAL
jgi:hypothetical protein